MLRQRNYIRTIINVQLINVQCYTNVTGTTPQVHLRVTDRLEDYYDALLVATTKASKHDVGWFAGNEVAAAAAAAGPGDDGKHGFKMQNGDGDGGGGGGDARARQSKAGTGDGVVGADGDGNGDDNGSDGDGDGVDSVAAARRELRQLKLTMKEELVRARRVRNHLKRKSEIKLPSMYARLDARLAHSSATGEC
jgi:hypothetical protein